MNFEIKKFLPGAGAGLCSVIVGYPFDTIKTRSQLSTNPSNINILNNIIKNEGGMSLYRGVMTPLLTLTFKRSYQYYLFDTLKKKEYNPFLSGGIAGISGTLFGCPMHVLKAQMQASTNKEYKNTLKLIKYIYANEGIKGFFRGFKINMSKDFVFGASFLGSYTYLKKKISFLIFKKEENILIGNERKLVHFFAGGISSTITWSLFYPFDHFETAIQTHKTNEYMVNKIRSNGIVGLWKGITPIVLRIFPVSAISMMIYEIIYESI